MSKSIDDVFCREDLLGERKGIIYRNIEHISYFSNSVGCERNANVVLPIGYSENKKYRVMYVLHGIFGNEETMLVAEDSKIPEIIGNMFLDDITRETIAVFVDMYASKEPLKTIEFKAEIFDPYNFFINDLINDLIPFIENRYSCLTDRDNRALFGFSMGGMESLYIGLSRSDLFGYVGSAAACPGLVPGKDWAMEHKGLFQEAELNYVYRDYPLNELLLACGSKDSVVGRFPFHYHEVLDENSVEHYWVEVPNLEHNEAIVQSTIYMFMKLWR